ncbi:MAG: lytic murein transglycosylase [Hyphomicrobiaceae bacterium]
MTGNANFMRSVGGSWRSGGLSRAWRAGVLALACVFPLAGSPSAGRAETPPSTGDYNCRNTGSFQRWLADFEAEAAAEGIPQRVIDAALGGMELDKGIIARDRKQSVFSQTFLEFSGRMVAKYRLDHGAIRLKKYRDIFQRVEKEFGVPGPVITAFWGLESDFGANMGDLSSLRSLATLAYDCRRPERFRPELKAALRIIERGDLKPADMIGSWAGELGQTQFLPTHYFNYAVDYDGDGRRDLLKSTPDVLASTGAFLKHLGWRAGEPWLEEVRVPADLDWKEADLAITHSRADWAKAGVTRADGKPLPADGAEASLLLLMGRNGPAFLAYRNFRIYLEWNQSLVYATTAAYFATRLAGAPPVSKGRAAVAPFGYQEIKELQRLLQKRGFAITDVDGKLGAETRAAVKAAQLKLGLPADSYPSPELLQRLR